MVAIVSGNSLGLSLSSLATLGQRGQLGTAGQGRSGEQSFVNIANGNLVLQNRDDILMGRGLDVLAVRTYNSQGLLTDDNGDNWSVGAFGQKVVLTSGAVGAAGSTLTRTDRDGAQAVYTWDTTQSRYVSSAGSGAFDTIAYDSGASQFIWTDGDSGLSERYQATGQGRLVSATDADGNTVSYAYNANGTVQSVTDANGDVSYYDYSGTNLTQIRTVSGGVTTTTVRYTYDASNRLSQVTVDLSPGDNSIVDGKVYTTAYTYDGVSKRVASVIQSDGTQLSFTYKQVGSDYRIETLTDALGAITRFSYDTAQNTTTVTDPLGAQSTYLYDAQGQLLQVRQGVTASNAAGLSQISYRYDIAGNVTGVTDGEGREVVYEYDGNGNLLKEIDSAGNLHTRTYNAANQLLTETVYADAAVSRGAFSQQASLPEVTRYVYAQDNPRLVRFILSAQGDVAEHRYNSYGQALATIRYTGGSYNVAALGASAVPTEAQMSAWVGSQDLRRNERIDRVYDARGALSSSTTYSEVDATGAGVAASAAKTQYVYDQHGWLLKSIDPSAGTTTYVYDGLGRVLSISAPSLDGGTTPNTTITSYDDANGKTSVTIASGLVAVSAYDKAGRLVSLTQRSAGSGVLGTTSYAYDKDGNLLMTQDPTGVRKWMLYDAADRKIADIDATGALVEYVYNASGQLRQTVAYATRLSAAKLGQLVDGAGLPTTAWSATNTTTSLAALRPAGVAQDQKVWRFYDAVGRLAWQVDALGYVTQTTYDGASRILTVTQLAKPIDVTPLTKEANVDFVVDPATIGGITLSLNNAGSTPLGQVVVLTATVDGASAGGMVSFFDGETVIGSALVIDGNAVLVTDRLSIGTHSLRVAYSGDELRLASVSKAVNKTIAPATTSARLDFWPSTPITYGQTVMVSVTLTTLVLPGLAPATGDVCFYSGNTLIGMATVINGLATLTTSSLPVGASTIRAEYAGDMTHTGAISSQTITVGLVPTVTKLESVVQTELADPSQAYDPFLLVASVKSRNIDFSSPVGSVTFYSGGTMLGTATLVNGVAALQMTQEATRQLTLEFLGATGSPPPFRAMYSGDAINAPSGTLDASGQTLASPTTIKLFSDLTETRQGGGAVNLTAYIDGVKPGGLVTFFAGTILLGTSTVHNYSASFSALRSSMFLPAGTYVLSAVYSGDASNQASVIAQGPTLHVSEFATSLGLGETLKRGDSIFSPSRRYQLIFQNDGNLVVYDRKESWQAVWNTQTARSEERRQWPYRVSFQSDGNLVVYEGTSNTKTPPPEGWPDVPVWNSGTWGKGASQLSLQDDGNLVIRKADGTALWWSGVDTVTGIATPGWTPEWLPSELPPAVRPDTVIVTAANVSASSMQVNASVSGAPSATGTFSFFSGQTLIASRPAGAGNVFTLPLLPLGTHSLTVVYSGDANNAAASGVLQLNVQPAATNLSLSTSRMSAVVGAPLTFSAKVARAGTWDLNSPPLGGTVTFYRNGIAIGTASVINDVATLTVSDLSLGTNDITASYSGTTNYKSANANLLSQQVWSSTATTTLTASPSASAWNAPITLTASVVGNGGIVDFYDGAVLLGSVAVTNGSASLVTSSLSVGAHTIQAIYSKDAELISSSVVYVSVGVTTLTNLTTPSIAKDGALSVRINGKTPTGLVSFYSGTTLLGTVVVREDGTATLRGVPIPVGTHTFSALYSGDELNADGALTFTQVVDGTPTTPILIGLDIAQDRTITKLYNRNGQLQGVLDGEGYLTEYKYNAAGEQIQTIRYADRAANFGSVSARMAATAIARASGDLAGLRPKDSPNDIRTYSFYNARGQLVGQVDSEGYLTETVYDVRGNVVQTKRYASPAKNPGSASATLATARPDPSALDQTVTQTWSAANQLLSRTNAEGTITSFTYDAAGRLVQTTTAVGTADERTQRLRYDIQGNLIAELDGRGSAAVAQNDPLAAWAANGSTHTYDATGRRTSTTDANGHRTLFFYDALGRLTYTVNALGEVTESRYNAHGQVFEQIVYGTRVNVSTLGATTPGGLNTEMLKAQLASVADATKDTHVLSTYNATGTKATTVDGLGNTTSYSYNAFREVTASTQTRLSGQVITDTVAFDRRGQQVSSTLDATGAAITRRTGYDAFGRVDTRTDANGNTTSLRYDRLGRVVTTTDANGAEHVTTYDAFDRVQTQRDAQGNTTSYAYNLADRSVTVTTPEGVSVTTVHNRQGQTSSVVDGRGNTTTYSYDKSGNLLQTQAPEGVSTSATYDKTGLKLSTTDARGTVTTYSYDAVNRLLTRTLDPSGLQLTTSYQYDAKGQTIRVTDPAGIVTVTEYDLNGRVTRQTVDPFNGAYVGLNLQTVYTHDADGTTLSVQGPDGKLTRYTYDGAGRRIKEQVDPLGLNLTRSYTYDAEGNVAKSVDAEGNATLFIYDKANRLAFTIDAMGGVQQNSYDAEGRLVSQSTYAAFVPVAAWNGVAPSLSTMQALLPTLGAVATQSRRYDRDGRLSFSVDATGAVVEYHYDAGGNVIETRAYAQRIDLTQWNGAIDPPVVADDAHDQRSRNVYDALGRKTYTIDGTGAVVQQVFDAAGNVKERFAYSLRVPGTTAAAVQALAAAVALVADPARDLHDIYAYDPAGRQISRTDGMGAVTTQTYDKNGNVTSRTDAKAQVTRYTYDTAGRLVHTLGPLGQLEKNTYDAAGRITLTTRYAKAVDTTGLGTALTPDQLQALIIQTPEQDQQQYSVYDKSGRLSATVDALGNVVTFVRDGNGQVTKRSAWASPIDMSTWVPGTEPAPRADTANDQYTRIFYDDMGREAFTVDALGYAVRRQYNAQGQLERITRYAAAVPTQTANTYEALLQAAANGAAGAGSAPQITVYGYDTAGNRIRQTSAFGQPEAATTLYVYDGLGQLTRTVDPRGVELSQSDTPSALNQRQQLGYINAGSGALKASDLSPAQREELAARYSTVNEYDPAGHKISVTDALGGITRSEYDATGHVVRITDPRGNAAFYYFDAAGRVTLSVDPEGYATATTYDPLGQTLGVKRYFNRVSGTYGIAQPPALPNANPSDALTHFEYDAAGRLSKTIDAESNSESYTYNALGQRETLTNKLGGITNYIYDQLGRKVSETLPITSRNAAGQSVAVVNRYAYDAFGNKASTTEAVGLPEQRVTQFKYDGLNREVEQRQAEVSIYTAAAGWTTATPTHRSTYDASGNLIAVVDPNGGRTRAWFDANNRKVAEVSAAGTLSTWAYDAMGNVMAQNIYGDALSLPVGDAQPAPINAANVRTTTYKVDANNRVLSSTIAQVEYGEYNAKTGQYTVFDRRDLIQRSFYDANGNVVRQENAANAAALTWYDKLGQKVLEIDAMGYGVRWERDANGAVFRETRFVKSIALGSLSESTALDTILAKFEPQASDQVTEYTYDRSGRTTSESRLGVAYASVGMNGALTESVAAAIQRYGYDAMGNRTSTTDALNQRTDRDYDQLGRLLSERKPQAAVNTGAGTSASLRQTSEYEYDGLNNIRREIRRGTDSAVETDDEIVRYGYDATGVRTSMVTAKGETFTYGRDANGNNTAQLVDRQDADGAVTREMVSIAYDAVNREATRFTGTRDAANAPVYDVAGTVTLGYNAWGELASKRTGSGDANGAAQEYYDYDKAGRLWRSNSQGGVSKAWLYDMAGNATLQLESQRLNLRTMSLQEMTGNGSNPSPDILVTITSYDKDNRAVSVVQPKMDASRPNLIMYAAALNVESGQYGGLDIAVANPLAGSTSIQAPSDTSATGAVSVLGMPFSGGSIRPITNGEAGIPGKPGNFSDTVVGVTDLVIGSAGDWTSNIENIYGAVTWRVEVGGTIAYLGRVTTWPQTVHPMYNTPPFPIVSMYLHRGLAYTNTMPIRIIATAQNTGQDIVVSTGAIRQPPLPTQDQTLSGTFMRLTAGEARDSDTIQLYSRPLGSNGPFSQTLPVFKAGEGGSSLNNTSVNGWYLTRLESLSGPTELMLVVAQADGKVVRRESIQWNPATRQSTSSVAAAQPVFTTDNVAHFTGLQTGGTSPAAIMVRSRSAPQGTGTMYWPAGTAGRFDIQLSPGNNDLAIDMLNDRGVVMDTLVGTMNPGSSLYDMRFIGSLPSSITFRDIPKDAATLTIEYSPTSAGGQPAGSVTLTRQAGKAEWVWDARNLVADPRSLYSYALHFVARDADGFILTDATGNATIGAVNNGTKAALTGSVKHQILTFDPGVPEGRTLKIRYREKGATASDFIEATATRGNINAIFKWDATANNLNPAKEYEFLYDVYNAAGAVISNGEGYFKPDTDISNDGSNSNAHWVIPNLPGGPVIPGQPPVVTGLWVVQRQQDYDAFGHVISEFDGNGNETKLYYNTLGLLTDKVGPTVDITLANGQVQTTRPTEYYSYDLNGRLVGKRDANGNQSTAQIDAAGRTVAEWHPGASAGSSTAVHKSYDIFGNLITVTDEIGRVTTNTYDLNNRLVRIDRPVNADGSHAFDTYEYDVVGQRIAHANALSFRERTYYDSMGRVTRYISAEGATVSYGYTYDNSIGSAGGVNTGGWVATTTDANGRTQTLKNDVFGRMMWKQDFGGHQFTYGYNWSGLIATQTGTSGQNISYTYYDNGYLRKVIDLGVSTESTFEYDNNGNRIFEGVKSTAGNVAMVFQWSRVSYDAYNRVKTIDDARYLINYEYDANGNRRRVKSTYKNVVDGSQEVQDYWYAYDGMNRFTVTMGQMVNGQIVRGASGDGVTIEYDDAGQRKAATYAAKATDPGHREDYAYDGAGNLTTMVLDGVLRSRRTNDLAGRVTRYEEWFKDGALSTQKDRTWNKDNQLTVEVEHRLTEGTEGRKWSDTTTAYTLMKDGTLSKVDSLTNSFNNFNPSAQDPAVVITRMISNYAYEWWDGAKQTSITLDPASTGYDPRRPQPPGYSVFGYDFNGHLKTASDVNRTTPRTFEYWTNAEGQVLQRQELVGGQVDSQTGVVVGASKSRDHRYFYFDGKRVGNVGNDGVEREDYAQQLARASAAESPDSKYRKFVPTNSADFDENYQPINASYPGPAPGSYTVRAGDTLEGIARALWGDAQLWYLLAEANGLDGQPSAPLVENTVLQVPSKVTNLHNTSNTFRPYDPGKAMGDTSPTLPDPLPAPKGKDGGCGGIGQIIMVVVAVVATIWTAGTAGAYFGAAGAGTGGLAGGVGVLTSGSLSAATIGAVAVGGAAGSIASQAVGIAIGAQDSFSWKGVAMGAIGAGVSAGIGGWLQGGGLGEALANSGNWATAGRLAVSNVATQGLNIATGLQKGFDWRGVAASAASGFVSASAGAWAQDAGWNMAGQRLASSMAGGLVSAAVRGGSISRALPGIIGDAVGSAMTVGNQVAGDIAGANRIDPVNPYGYQGSASGITNWQVNNAAAIPPKTQLSDEDIAQLYSENAWLSPDIATSLPSRQYADAARILRAGVATDAGPVGSLGSDPKSDAYRLVGAGMRPTPQAEDALFGSLTLKLRIAQDAADAANIGKADYSLLPEGTSVRWLPALNAPSYSIGDTLWDGVKATWNSVVIGGAQLGVSVLSAYARTSANYQETLGAGWIGPRLASPYPSESAFDLSPLVPPARYDTPYGSKVETLADVAQLFAGGYGAVKWVGAKTLVAGLGAAYANDADASRLGDARKLLRPVLGESVALEHVTQSGVAIVRTGEKAYAQLSLQGKTQDYRELIAKLDDLNPVANEFQIAAQSIRDRLSFNDLPEQWRNRITEARLVRSKEPWIANRFESAAYGTEVHEEIGLMLRRNQIRGGELYEYRRTGPDLVPKNPLGLKMEITNYTPSLSAIVTHAKRYSTQNLRYILYQAR